MLQYSFIFYGSKEVQTSPHQCYLHVALIFYSDLFYMHHGEKQLELVPAHFEEQVCLGSGPAGQGPITKQQHFQGKPWGEAVKQTYPSWKISTQKQHFQGLSRQGGYRANCCLAQQSFAGSNRAGEGTSSKPCPGKLCSLGSWGCISGIAALTNPSGCSHLGRWGERNHTFMSYSLSSVEKRGTGV